MPKRKEFTKREVNQILKIENDHTKMQKIAELAEKFGRTKASVYSKWNALTMKGGIKRVKVTDGRIEPLVLVIDTNILSPTRADEGDIKKVQRALDAVMPDLKPHRGNIPMDNKYVNIAKRHLSTKYPEMVFTFTRVITNGKPAGFTRIFRRK